MSTAFKIVFYNGTVFDTLYAQFLSKWKKTSITSHFKYTIACTFVNSLFFIHSWILFWWISIKTVLSLTFDRENKIPLWNVQTLLILMVDDVTFQTSLWKSIKIKYKGNLHINLKWHLYVSIAYIRTRIIICVHLNTTVYRILSRALGFEPTI